MARPLIPFVQNGYYASRNWIPLVKGNGFTTSGGGEQEEVWETASGPIVTFDAVAAPLRQLSVAVEPVQNLNGYDNPWPAGGGKNKANFPVDASLPYSELITTVFDAGEDITVSNLVLSFFLQNAAFSNGSGAICDFKKNDGTHQYRVGGLYGIVEGQAYTGQFSHAESNITFRYLNVMMGADYIHFTSGKASIQLEMDTATATAFSPYSNLCPISGWTEAKVTRTGENLVKFPLGSSSGNGVIFNNNNGVITCSGTANEIGLLRSDAVSVTPGDELFIEGCPPGGASNTYRIDIRDADRNLLTASYDTGSGVAFTVPSGVTELKIGIRINAGTNTNGLVFKPCVSLASSRSAYTIDLNGTRYGGTLDVVNGKMTVDKVAITIDGVNVRANGVASYGQNVRVNIAYPTGLTAKYSGAATFCISDKLHASYQGVIAGAESAFSDVRVFPHFSALMVNFPPSFGVTSIQTTNEWFAANTPMVCYPLATPFELTLTPEQISTLQGTNNVWSDAGDVTVEYRVR